MQNYVLYDQMTMNDACDPDSRGGYLIEWRLQLAFREGEQHVISTT